MDFRVMQGTGPPQYLEHVHLSPHSQSTKKAEDFYFDEPLSSNLSKKKQQFLLFLFLHFLCVCICPTEDGHNHSAMAKISCVKECHYCDFFVEHNSHLILVIVAS